jgi:hypothetical protein
MISQDCAALFESLADWSQLVPPDGADLASQPDANNDLQALAMILCRLSRGYGLTWQLSVMGEPIGTIENGECDDLVWGKIMGLADMIRHISQHEYEEPPAEEADEPPRSILQLWPGPDD